MILQASNGCLLTQSEDVSIKDRRFEKSMLVASIEEANKWKEIPESEKDRIIVESQLFEPEGGLRLPYKGKQADDFHRRKD